MPALVDLTAAPYHLDADQIAWVEQTLASMTLDEQVGQLFTNLFFFGEDSFSGNAYTAEQIIEKVHIGLARYHGGDAAAMQALLNRLQRASTIPMLVAANCDSGGNGAMSDGTYVASGAQTEASRSTEVAFNAGYVSGRRCGPSAPTSTSTPASTSCRTGATPSSTPVPTARTPPTSSATRSRSSRGSVSRACSRASSTGPGDGTEERDQHLVLGINELTPAEWEASFGEVYRAHIANGVEMVMAGHIALPH